MPNPIFIPMEFAKNGIKNVIQKVRQSGQDAQDMTWNDGTPSITLTKLEDGGLPPKGQDYNGVLNAISSHTVFNQNGGRYKWDPQVVIEFGGYPKDAIVQSSDGTREYISLIDNNQINPDSSTTGTWSIYAGQGSVPLATSTTTGIMRVLNVLTSTDVGSALSAAMGKQINDFIQKFTSSVAENGYLRIPSGDRVLIIQWGFNSSTTNANTNTTKAVDFNIQFPTRALIVMSTPSNSYNNGYLTLSSETPTRDGFALVAGSSRAGIFNFTWLSIGY